MNVFTLKPLRVGNKDQNAELEAVDGGAGGVLLPS